MLQRMRSPLWIPACAGMSGGEIAMLLRSMHYLARKNATSPL
jgi:hypothetical protein